MSASTPTAVLAHVIAAVTLGGVAAQLVVAATTEPKNLVWGAGILLLTLTALVTGWLITLRRPGNPLGWLIVSVPLLLGLQGYAEALATLLVDQAPVAASWFDWYGGDNEWNWLPPTGILFTQVPLRFPNGALPSPRWRWFSRATIGAIVLASVIGMTGGQTVGPHVPNPTYVDFGGATDLISLVGFGLLVAAMVGSVASMAVRYRHGGLVERAQMRWLFWAVSVVAGLLVVGWLITALAGGTSDDSVGGVVATVWILATSLAYSLVPLAILFAVLRRGLFSIDRIISRTAAYSVVTLIVVGTYFAVVLLVSILLPGRQGQTPPLVVALATLAAAAVFLPALRLIRRSIDRVFDRSSYDAERVV